MPKITLLKDKRVLDLGAGKKKRKRVREAAPSDPFPRPAPKPNGLTAIERAARAGQGVSGDWVERKEISLGDPGELISCGACGSAFPSEKAFMEHDCVKKAKEGE